MHDLDFIPASYHHHQSLRRAVGQRAALLGGLAAIMAVWMVAHHHRLAAADAMVKEVQSQEEQIAIHLQRKQEMFARQAGLQDRRRLIELLDDQRSLVLVLSDISRRIPETLVLTETTVESPSIARFASAGAGEAEGVAVGPGGARVKEVATASGAMKPSAVVLTEVVPDGRSPRLVIRGIATSTPDVIQFAAALESSPLLEHVQMDVKGPKVWAGRRAQEFEISCELLRQEGGPR